ncbi:BPSL0761 family protein [Pseudoxanthomonas mexicana]
MLKIGSKPNLRQGSQHLRRSPRILTESQCPGGFAMTMPDERTRALLWAGGFLIELARDDSLPLSIRRRALVIGSGRWAANACAPSVWPGHRSKWD